MTYSTTNGMTYGMDYGTTYGVTYGMTYGTTYGMIIVCHLRHASNAIIAVLGCKIKRDAIPDELS